MSGNDDDDFIAEDVKKGEPAKPVITQPGVELDEDGKPIKKASKAKIKEEDK